MQTNKTGPLAAARARAEGRHVRAEDLLLVEGSGEYSPPPSARKQTLAASVGKLLLSAKKGNTKRAVVAFSTSADATTQAGATATRTAAAPSALRSFEALLADIDRHLSLGGVSPAVAEKAAGREKASKSKKKSGKEEEEEDFATALAAGGPLGTAPRAARQRRSVSASPSANLIDLDGDGEEFEEEEEEEEASFPPAPAVEVERKKKAGALRQPNFFDSDNEVAVPSAADPLPADAITTTVSSYEDAPEEIEEGCGECGFDDDDEEGEEATSSSSGGGGTAASSSPAPATASRGLVASVLDWAGRGNVGSTTCEHSVSASSRGARRRPGGGGDEGEDEEEEEEESAAASSVAAAAAPAGAAEASTKNNNDDASAAVAALEALLEASERERARLAAELDAARRDLAAARQALRLQRGAAVDVLRKLKSGEEGEEENRGSAEPAAIAASPSPAAAAAASKAQKAKVSLSPSPRRKVLEAAAAFERGGGSNGGRRRKDEWSPAAAVPRPSSSPASAASNEGSKRPAWSPVGSARLIR